MAGAGTATQRRTYARRRLVVGAIVVLLLALVAALLVVPRLLDSPGRARRAFVEALAAGDAGKLVGVTRELPASARAGVAAMATAGGLPTNPGTFADGISFDLAGAHHEVALPVEKVDGRWKVANPVGRASLAGFPVAAKIDGAAATSAEVPLLPGRHVLESADPLLRFEPATLTVVDPAAAVAVPSVVPALTDEGRAAVRAAAADSLRACLARTGLVVDGCPNAATQPPGVALDAPTVAWSLAGTDPTAALDVALEPGKPWGTSAPLSLPLQATGRAIRAYDATATTYSQPVTVTARVFASIADGRVTIRWTS